MEEGRKGFPRYSSFKDNWKFSASPSLPAAVALLRYQHTQPDISSSETQYTDSYWEGLEEIWKYLLNFQGWTLSNQLRTEGGCDICECDGAVAWGEWIHGSQAIRLRTRDTKVEGATVFTKVP